MARSAFFLSGAAGLIFEIVWLRHLGRTLGATTVAVATTTAAYMGGLALGSHLGGKIADRLRRPLAVYGVLEVAVAAMGALVPWLCGIIPIFDERWLADLESGFGRALVRFFVAFAVLIIPTTAMGMTLPVLSRAVAPRLGTVGREVGALYAINIAGAVAGAALAGFVLIPHLGLAATNLTAVAIDVSLGCITIAAGSYLRPMTAETPSLATAPIVRAEGGQLVGLLAVTGAAAMALQVLWTRALGTALGPSTYAFSAIVCAYLVGLAGGGAWASRLADRVRSIRHALAGVLAATAAATWAGIAVVDDLPSLLHPVVLDPTLTMGGLVRTEFALAALSVVPAAVGMGTLFPLTIAAVVGSEARIGAAVGRAYAVNTLGNIAGSFAGVFILLPTLGVEWGMRAAASSYVVLALLLVARPEPTTRPSARRAVAVGATLVAAALVAWPGWDIARWTVGLFRMSMARSFFPQAGKLDTSRVIFHADGLASTVTVEEEAGTRWIKVNGKIDGSSEGDMPTQVLSGLLPMLVHPAPERVAVIGCGSCVTVGAALQGDPDEVTLIELEPEVVRAARLFGAVNHEPWNDPRLTIVEDDGRNYMMRRGPAFDVIISEPSNPWMTGAASLFTLEFFEIAARRLAPDGLFLQWLQAYELAPERIASVLATFHAVFPEVLVFSAHPDSNDLLLLGSRSELALPRARLARRFDELASEFARAGLRGLDDLLALLLLSSPEVYEVARDATLNTDDNALIEFGAPRDLVAFAETDPELPFLALNLGERAAMVRRLGGIGSDPGMSLDLAQAYLRQGMLVDAAQTAREVATAAAGDPVTERAEEIAAIAALLDEPDDREAVIDLGLEGTSQEDMRTGVLIARDETKEALQRFEGPGGHPPKTTTERLLYAYLLYRNQRYEAARSQLLLARGEAPPARQAAVSYYLARSDYYDGQYARAVTEMRSYRALKARPLSISRKPD